MDHTHHVATFSYFTAVCFTVNYIVGCGFLGIPNAFVTSGIVAGPILVVVFALLCNVTKDYVLEVLSRLEALEKVWSRVCPVCSAFCSASLVPPVPWFTQLGLGFLACQVVLYSCMFVFHWPGEGDHGRWGQEVHGGRLRDHWS